MSNFDERPFRIAFLLIDGFALMSYASAIEPLRAANRLSGKRLYTWQHLSATGQSARASTDALVPVDRGIGGVIDADLLLVVAAGDPVSYANAAVFRWLRAVAGQGVALGGVSGGPVLLAKAGVMADRRMTVHWEHAPALSELVPDLHLSRALYVFDRDRLTCAGGIAPLDMMHSLLEQHHGARFAREVSDWFMHTDIRPAGGPQRAGVVERFGVNNHVVVEVIGQMQDHLADPLTLGDLAALAGRTDRQLNRLFQDHLSQSTMRFYRDLRLDHAQQLLRQSPMTVTEVAYASGFSSGAHFAAAVRQRFGAAPSDLRAQRAD